VSLLDICAERLRNAYVRAELYREEVASTGEENDIGGLPCWPADARRRKVGRDGECSGHFSGFGSLLFSASLARLLNLQTR
jgi:hypothetical protein